MDRRPGLQECFLLTGYEGDFCQDDVNECEAGSPCNNGGNCNNTDGSFICTCLDGYGIIIVSPGTVSCVLLKLHFQLVMFDYKFQ